MNNEEKQLQLMNEVSTTLKSLQVSKSDSRKNIMISAAIGVITAITSMIAVHQFAQSQAQTQYDLSKSHYEREITALKKEVEVKDGMILQLISFATTDTKKAKKLAEALKNNIPSK